MKKLEKMLFMLVLTICTVVLVGIDKVYAEPYNIASTFTIVCEPNTLSAGGRTDCYLVGKPEPASGNYSLHGYLTYAYTTDSLELKGASKNKNIANSDALFLEPSSATQGHTSSGNQPKGLDGFRCQLDSANVDSGNDFGCVIFYTISGKTNAFTPASIVANNSAKIVPGGDTSYGVIGSYSVAVAKDVQGESCGELCVKAWNVPTENDYNHVTDCATDGKKSDGTACGGITALQTVSTESGYFCREVHYKGGTNPDTGTFASYTLLIAGALIAIAAVTLAKKNTKLYRV